jgi:hypothetical protein
MQKPLVVYCGFVGKVPLAGMTLANLHPIRGLQSLGYEVHYVERLDQPLECYDPRAGRMTDNPGFALQYLADFLPRAGLSGARYSFIDRENRCHGSGWPALREAISCAEFVLCLGTGTWFDDLARCPRRAFIDADPLFTQVAMETERGQPHTLAETISHYPVLLTEGMRVGKADCSIPTAGRAWIPVPPTVSTALWQTNAPRADAPVTTVMNWESGSDIVHDGRTYGYKKREFEAFMQLPKRSRRSFTIGIGGNAPRVRLRESGWGLANPLEVTGTIEAYQRFIADSWADLGIAKHAYIATRSGWFSDRSLCYLASGRPVLHQDTGFTDWLPSGEGVFAFSNIEDVLTALEALERDYARHAKAARAIAEEYFEASMVIGRMLDQAGFR